jgi:hypothetical protein
MVAAATGPDLHDLTFTDRNNREKVFGDCNRRTHRGQHKPRCAREACNGQLKTQMAQPHDFIPPLADVSTSNWPTTCRVKRCVQQRGATRRQLQHLPCAAISTFSPRRLCATHVVSCDLSCELYAAPHVVSRGLCAAPGAAPCRSGPPCRSPQPVEGSAELQHLTPVIPRPGRLDSTRPTP